MLIEEAVGEALRSLLRQEQIPTPPALDRTSVPDSANREQPSTLVESNPVDFVKLRGGGLVAKPEPNAVGQPLWKIGDDIDQEIAVDAVRLARTAHDQPVAAFIARGRGHYSRISSTKRFWTFMPAAASRVLMARAVRP